MVDKQNISPRLKKGFETEGELVEKQRINNFHRNQSVHNAMNRVLILGVYVIPTVGVCLFLYVLVQWVAAGELDKVETMMWAVFGFLGGMLADYLVVRGLRKDR
ncbi:MAG: hypothetical protein HN726_02785 [Candidatus Magasanikbacteria bacterium]|jgi:hypothetical protein|nr:hypothetical protein [Candidatus Magasanikbacteria bacterium]MBT4220744.1 hypothetical protein [Candidatus Magasanikbacteria bacterium]MBT4350089.1 hypothetical protein [Candidatus Magasanikbacteria bacterium]MBT4541468.1 hypothetical protein [Candidatus Magasanikbacteria bacterium]MBT6252996.1 hypothetical protein [Candidatus Magasanikbacteria bacterium]